MKKCTYPLLLLFLLPLVAAHSSDRVPERQILGLRLSMTAEEARTRLKQIGTFVRDEAMQQEVWKVRDPSYADILLGFARDTTLRYITAVAREDKDAKLVPYTAIGDPAKAKQAGNPAIKVYNYQWHLPAEKGEPETLVVALGRDATNLSTYSLKRLGEGAAPVDSD